MQESKTNSGQASEITAAQILVKMKILWAALLASTVFYFVILMVKPGAASGTNNPLLIYIFAGLAIVFFVLSLILPDLVFKQSLKQLGKTPDTSSAMKCSFPAFVIRLALCEAISVYGFMASFLGRTEFYYPFWLGSFIAFLLAFPSEEKIMVKVKA